MISELTTLELKDAPQEVRDIIREIPEENIDYEESTEEAVNLARKYIVEGVIGEGKLVDAEHIAIATINRVDVLVSWNFKHIVNLSKIRGYNSRDFHDGIYVTSLFKPDLNSSISLP